jgi:hypothetical protein
MNYCLSADQNRHDIGKRKVCDVLTGFFQLDSVGSQ